MPRLKSFDEKEVLTKAMNLFWTKGYSATSIQDLVTHLGINRASLYNTFGDKDQLFKMSFDLYRISTIEQVSQLFSRNDQVKQGLAELFYGAIEDVDTDRDSKGCFFVNTITEMVPNDMSLMNAFEVVKADFINLFFQYLKKGKETGQLQTQHDLKSLATFLFVVYNGLKVVSKVNSDKTNVSESVTLALTLVV